MKDTLLRSAIWYLSKWGMNPVFCNIFKKPLHDWGGLHGSALAKEDVIRLYREAKSGGKPAGVALLPSATSRVVILDLDIYRVEFGLSAQAVASTLAEHGFVVATTPRGGVRVAVSVVDGDPLPGRITISWFGKAIGEGSGAHKHLWHFPPSVACLETDGGRCRKIGRYEFVIKGRTTKYPWDIGVDRPPTFRWSEAVELLRAILQVEVVEDSQVASTGGDLKPGSHVGGLTIPCWRSLAEFEEWLSGLRPPSVPLPACVARALGYRVTEDLRNEYTGEKVPYGMRYVLGATATMFLAASIASATVEEIVDFVGRNLEGFPADEGEPLNTKLSRLLATSGSFVFPRYSGLGAIASSLPVDLCGSCHYSQVCRTSPSGGNRFVPWLAFSMSFWNALLPPRRDRNSILF